MAYGGSIYILTNKNKTTLYTGVTSDLGARIRQHRDKAFPKSFTARYNLTVLIYMEHFSSIEEAIQREKAIKAKTRINKEKLINSVNPNWDDLANEVLNW